MTYSSICSLFIYTFMDLLHVPVSLLGIEDAGEPGLSLLSQNSQGGMEKETGSRGHTAWVC